MPGLQLLLADRAEDLLGLGLGQSSALPGTPLRSTAPLPPPTRRTPTAPAANYNGPDTFIYTISDGHGGTASAMVSLTVTGVNDAPLAANDSYSTNEDTALTIAAPAR